MYSFKPYEGDEKYIFISYSHRDGERVRPIFERLFCEGFNIWYDDGIDVGTEFPEVIAEHIKNCSEYIYFISNNSVNSDFCRNELTVARSKKKRILPVYLEDTEIPDGLELQIANYQKIFMWQYSESFL